MSKQVDLTDIQKATVSLSIADVTIKEAAALVVDGDAHYLRWMPAIIDRFRLTYAEYWELTVAEHQTFIDYLEIERGAGGES